MVARFHYDDAIFQRLLQDKLRPQEQQDVTRHIESCTECQAKLETLVESGVDWTELRDYLKPSETPASRDQANRDSIWVGFLEPSERPDSLGRFGRYEILEILGRGGTGIVMRGYDPSLDRQSAIKVLSPQLAASAAARKRFSREAKSAAAVVHEHVVPIQTVDQEQGLPYLVMPVLEGRSLEDRIRNNGPLDVKEVLRIGRQIASGLAAAHQQGLVHRDVKPANILLHNGVERVVITDFGLARAVDDASMTQSGTLVGTPQYMSPEQARGQSLDARSDLFSLGSVLYFMLVGHSPFRAETTMGVLNRITSDQPRSLTEQNPEIPAWLDQIIRRLLSKQPEDRYQTAAEVELLLGQWLAHQQDPNGTPRPTEPPPTETEGGSRRRNLLLAVVGGFALLLAGILIVLETNKGTLTIQSDASDVTVRITQGDEVAQQLTVVQGDNQVRLAAGKYVVEIEGEHDELTVKNAEVTLLRGDKKLVHIVEHNQAVPAEERLFRRVGIGPDGQEVGVPVKPNAVTPQPDLGKVLGLWVPATNADNRLKFNPTSNEVSLDSVQVLDDKVRFLLSEKPNEKQQEKPFVVDFVADIDSVITGDNELLTIYFKGLPSMPVEGTLQQNGERLTLTLNPAKNSQAILAPLPATWELEKGEAKEHLSTSSANSKDVQRDLTGYRSGEALPASIRVLQGTWTAVTAIGDELKDYNNPLASVRFTFKGMNVGMQIVDPQQNVVEEIWGTMTDHGYVEFAFPDQPKLKVSFQSSGSELTLDVVSDEAKKFRTADLPAKWQLQRGVLVRDPASDGKVVTAELELDWEAFQLFVRKRDNLFFTYRKKTDNWQRYQFPAGVKVHAVTIDDSLYPDPEHECVGFDINGGPISELVAIDAKGKFCVYPFRKPTIGRSRCLIPSDGQALLSVFDGKAYVFVGKDATWQKIDLPPVMTLLQGAWEPVTPIEYERQSSQGKEVISLQGIDVMIGSLVARWQVRPIHGSPWYEHPMSWRAEIEILPFGGSDFMMHVQPRGGEEESKVKSTLWGSVRQDGDMIIFSISDAENPPPELGPLPLEWKLKKVNPLGRQTDSARTSVPAASTEEACEVIAINEEDSSSSPAPAKPGEPNEPETTTVESPLSKYLPLQGRWREVRTNSKEEAAARIQGREFHFHRQGYSLQQYDFDQGVDLKMTGMLEVGMPDGDQPVPMTFQRIIGKESTAYPQNGKPYPARYTVIQEVFAGEYRIEGDRLKVTITKVLQPNEFVSKAPTTWEMERLDEVLSAGVTKSTQEQVKTEIALWKRLQGSWREVPDFTSPRDDTATPSDHTRTRLRIDKSLFTWQRFEADKGYGKALVGTFKLRAYSQETGPTIEFNGESIPSPANELLPSDQFALHIQRTLWGPVTLEGDQLTIRLTDATRPPEYLGPLPKEWKFVRLPRKDSTPAPEQPAND
ncbi:serine/threonine protein kinase [Bremerella cremea]|uniref:non-specific serine/threonine protein kinase n=1 Tax=Bremerella cremea TaxID=1031537 RepID=A0A368KPG3_9BACT|nr:serine/threonine-protein kinase [Bremerella cremea]RCS46432.1 serine/threonine protein kinase [Bremerella cremea]